MMSNKEKISRLKFAARHNSFSLNMPLAKRHISNDLQNIPPLKLCHPRPLPPKYVFGSISQQNHENGPYETLLRFKGKKIHQSHRKQNDSLWTFPGHVVSSRRPIVLYLTAHLNRILFSLRFVAARIWSTGTRCSIGNVQASKRIIFYDIFNTVFEILIIR